MTWAGPRCKQKACEHFRSSNCTQGGCGVFLVDAADEIPTHHTQGLLFALKGFISSLKNYTSFFESFICTH